MRRSQRILGTMVTALMFLVIDALPAKAATTAGLWHMDESSGQAIDSSGMGNNGTLENVTRVAPGFDGTGRAYSFNGTSSRVVIPNSSSLNPGALDVSMTAHVKFSVIPPPSVADYDLIRKGTGIYKMEIRNTGQAFCKFKGSTSGLSVKKGPNLADGQWHTIVCRKTSSNITLTVDGTSYTKSGSVGSISSGDPLYFGAKPNGEDRYNGILDEVTIVFG
jgi:hypothetical protein